MTAYHDTEWGVPQHSDQVLFEFLVLEGAQAGLSWSTVLHRREGYRRAFAGFAVDVVAAFDQTDVDRLLADAGIVRNRAKVASAIGNARAVRAVQAEIGSLDRYLWSFVGGSSIRHRYRSLAEVPAETPESGAMSADLRRRGFSFVGPTICYALMQATGMVNDHEMGCFRWSEVEPG